MLGLAILRHDGFVSLNGGLEPGFALTRELLVNGDELRINVGASQGYSVVALTFDRGEPLEGYRSSRVQIDSTNAAVHFPQPLAALAGREVRLRMELQDAELFAYWFANNNSNWISWTQTTQTRDSISLGTSSRIDVAATCP